MMYDVMIRYDMMYDVSFSSIINVFIFLISLLLLLHLFLDFIEREINYFVLNSKDSGGLVLETIF